MKDTDRKAKSGMSHLVVTIFGVALLIAGIYIVFWTPGEPVPPPGSNAIGKSD
jgi:hypothetical protein